MIILLEFQSTIYKCFMQTKVYCGSSCTSPKIESRTNCKNPLVSHAHSPPHDVCTSRPVLQWCHANRTQIKEKERSDPKIARSLWRVTVKVRNK